MPQIKISILQTCTILVQWRNIEKACFTFEINFFWNFSGLPYQQTPGGATNGYPAAYPSTHGNGTVDSSGVILSPPPYSPPYTPHAIGAITEEDEGNEADAANVHTYDNNGFNKDDPDLASKKK